MSFPERMRRCEFCIEGYKDCYCKRTPRIPEAFAGGPSPIRHPKKPKKVVKPVLPVPDPRDPRRRNIVYARDLPGVWTWFSVMELGWDANCGEPVRMIGGNDEYDYTGEGYLSRDDLVKYIEKLQTQAPTDERAKERLATARQLLRDMDAAHAVKVDYLPPEYAGLPDHLRTVATELLMQDAEAGEITQGVIDHARRRHAGERFKFLNLEDVNELAEVLRLD
jgi:hypothetical protein